ncbi:MAG TPA: FmdB family zinc ribbon protein [Fimbriimonadaceae bacterium]|nr:FmdB family zinc ribbon protein [Fimbriimonadaceae bacterium]
MPTYVYECSACSDVFEVEQRITEEPLNACHCGSSGTVKRVIQPVGIAFKGSGFYVTDSASKPSAPKCTGEPSTCSCSTEKTE